MKITECCALFLVTVLLADSVICAGKDSGNLLISVLQTDDPGLARTLLANAPDTAGNTSAQQTNAGVYSTDRLRHSGEFQQVRVTAGQTAHLATVSRFPEAHFLWAENSGRRLSSNVGLAGRESESGFYVRAELQGNEVSLQLHQYSGQTRADHADYGSLRNIRTIVQGHSGDWLDAGGSLPLEDELSAGHGYTLQRRDRTKTRLLIKVEIAP